MGGDISTVERQKWVSVNCYFSAGDCVSIIDAGRCTDRRSCGKACVYTCPAGLFEEKDGRVCFNPGGRCLECGACRLLCDNLVFDYPPAGRGIVHKFG